MKWSWDTQRPFDVVGIGRNSWDRIALVRKYPDADQKVSVMQLDDQAGGQVATTMVTIARLGAKTKYLGKIGDDTNGRAVRTALVREGVDLTELQVIPGVPNQSAFIVVDHGRKTRTVFSHTDSLLRIQPNDFRLEAVQSGKILYLGARQPMDVLSYAKLGRATNTIVAIDADTVSDGLAELVSVSDIFFCPKDVPLAFTKEPNPKKALETIAKMGPRVVCCTQGASGAVALVDGLWFASPAYPVETLDTTGAGDVFHGAFLVGLLAEWDPPKLMTFSNIVAGLKCKSLGGQRGIPSRSLADETLKSCRIS